MGVRKGSSKTGNFHRRWDFNLAPSEHRPMRAGRPVMESLGPASGNDELVQATERSTLKLCFLSFYCTL